MDTEGMVPRGFSNCDDISHELGDEGFFRGHYDTDPIISARNSRFMGAVLRSEESMKDERTLISRQWHYVMPLSLLSYILLQVIINTQSAFCNRIDPFASWTYEVGIAVASCFGLSACYNIANGLAVESWAQKETEHLRAVYAGAATMSIIAGSSTIVYLTDLGDAVCRDALGMDTPNCQWPEWLIAAPLLVYIAIAIEDKRQLTVEDCGIILLMFLCIFFGFVMNFFVDLAWGIILFILSSLCMVGNIVLALKAKENTKNQESSKLLSHQWVMERMRMKSKLAQLLFWLLPLFVFVYILGIVSILDRDEVIVANMLIGLVVKLFFVSTLSLESVVMQFASERKVNDRRRQFLRYVFHEVRVPLNTITMGITVLKDDAMVLDESRQEVVAMMDAAAGFMSNTLNDVLSMSKIEDGAISLVVKPFTLISLLESAMRAVRNLASSKAVRIIVKGLSPRDEARSLTVLGDENRLQLVLVNFLSNAVKFSIAGSVVTIEVGSALKSLPRKLSEFSSASFLHRRSQSVNKTISKRMNLSFFSRGSRIQQSPSKESKSLGNRDCQIRYVTVLVNDLGVGIPEDDHGKLFQAFAQIRPHDLEGKGGRGSGLGLVMAKEIITLHGGEVLFKSELGVGSSFGFTIPFTVLELNGLQQNIRSAHHRSHQISSATFTQDTKIRSKLILPSLSIRILPLRGQLARETSLSERGDHIFSSHHTSVQNVFATSANMTEGMEPDPIPDREPEQEGDSALSPFIMDLNRQDEKEAEESSIGMEVVCGDVGLEVVDDVANANEQFKLLKIPSTCSDGDNSAVSASVTSGALCSTIASNTASKCMSNSMSNSMSMSLSKSLSVTSSKSCSERTPVTTMMNGKNRMSPDTGMREGKGLIPSTPGPGTGAGTLTGVCPTQDSSAARVGDSAPEKKMTFLLVDDTASNCKMLKMLLNKKGIVCDMAFNGLEAVTAYKAAIACTSTRKGYEVIFMDYTMPIMNGLEATTSLRKLGFKGLVVGLTGNALDDDVSNFIQAGADCVFSKPFREEHLASLLHFLQEHGCESSLKSHSLIKPEQKKFYKGFSN